MQIFVSYSHEDTRMKDSLLTHLSSVERLYGADIWTDGEIKAGERLTDEILAKLKSADIILLLVSASYIKSNFCFETEMVEALTREQKGQCIIIPVILRKTSGLLEMPFAKYTFVPKDGKPIASFAHRNDGYAEAAEKILEQCKAFSNRRTSKATNQLQSTSKRRGRRTASIKLYKDGRLQQIPLSQKIIDFFPKYVERCMLFEKMLAPLVQSEMQHYQKQYASKRKRHYWRTTLFRGFLLQIAAYSKSYMLGEYGVRVHFRCFQNGQYYGMIAVDEDEEMAVKLNWARELTTMPSREGMIFHSNRLKAPLIKSLNPSFHVPARHDAKWDEYLTYALTNINEGDPALLSFGISINKRNAGDEVDTLLLMAYTDFTKHISQYISEYIVGCRQIDSSFNLKSIISDYLSLQGVRYEKD